MKGPVRLVVTKTALEEAARSGELVPAFGFTRLRENLIQVFAVGSPAPEGFSRVGEFMRKVGPTTGDFVEFQVGDVRLAYLPEHIGIGPEKGEVVDVAAGLDGRRSGILGQSALAAKTVALIGAGSVGSMVGVSLAEAGVGNFYVVDNDFLDANNLSRHACDLMDVGRPKASAVADLLRRRMAHARAFPQSLLELSEHSLNYLVENAGLVVATTDSPAVQFVVNEVVVKVGTPALFVGAYERAAGGEIILVRPGVGPCFYCAVGFRAGFADAPTPKERRLAYQEADKHRLEAEPGLGADIAYLASVASAFALAVLDPTGSRGELAGSGSRFVLVHGGSRPRGNEASVFTGPFDFVNVQVRRDEPCPVCGWVSKAR